MTDELRPPEEESKRPKAWVEPSGDGWRCRWLDHAGRHHQQTFVYKADADELCKKKRANIKRIEAGLVPHADPAAATLLPLTQKRLKYCRRELEQSTVNKFDAPAMSQLVEFFGDVPIAAITDADLEDWLDWLREDKGYSETTVAMRYSHAAPVFTEAKARGLVEINPFDVVDKPKGNKGARLLTEPEIARMLEVLPPFMQQATVLALCSGMRKEEEQILDWQQHVDVSRPIWEINLQGHETKNGKPKVVPVGPRVQAVLGPPSRGRVIPRLTNAAIQYWFTGKMGEPGPVFRAIGRVRWHDLKHYFCTNYLRDTGDIYGCSAITGNTIKSLEENYRHWLRPRTDRIEQVQFPFLKSLPGPQMGVEAQGGDSGKA